MVVEEEFKREREREVLGRGLVQLLESLWEEKAKLAQVEPITRARKRLRMTGKNDE